MARAHWGTVSGTGVGSVGKERVDTMVEKKIGKK